MPAHIRNTDLCALMDGECAARERDRIEAALALRPQYAERLAAWRRNDAALRYAFSVSDREAAAPVIEATPVGREASREPSDAPLTHAPVSRTGLRNAKAAVTAAIFGAAGAAAITFGALLFAPQ